GAAQTRVQEPGDAPGAGRARAPHRLVDRRDGGNAVVEQDLVGAEPQRRGGDALHAVERPIEETAEEIVDPAAPAQRSIDELGRERAVDRAEAAARELAVQQHLPLRAPPLPPPAPP